MALGVQVECYAGYKADEKPRRFAFVSRRAGTAGERTRTHEVQEVVDQWYGVGYQCFKVRTDDGHLYILRHHRGEADYWTLDSFRATPSDRSRSSHSRRPDRPAASG